MKSELEVSLVKEDLRVKSANWEYRAGLFFFSFVILDVCFTYSFFPNYCKTACVLWSLAHVQHTQCFIAGVSLTIEDTFYFIFFPFELLQCVPSPSALFGKAFFFNAGQFGRKYVRILLFSSLLPVWLSVLTVTYTGKGNSFSVNHDGLLLNSSFISGDEK